MKQRFGAGTIAYLFAYLFLSSQVARAQTISAAEAKSHIGQTATVCGKVASTHYAPSARNQPTFIDLDEPYPRAIFTIVIWGADRPKFGEPEKTHQGKDVCVSGKITDYKGVPEVVATEPEQIKAQTKTEK